MNLITIKERMDVRREPTLDLCRTDQKKTDPNEEASGVGLYILYLDGGDKFMATNIYQDLSAYTL